MELNSPLAPNLITKLSVNCEMQFPSIVNGNWGSWGEWRLCNQPCGTGLQIRKRYCDSPAPLYKGLYCEGDDTQSKECNSNPCEGKVL